MVDRDVITRLERLEAKIIAHDGRVERLAADVAVLRAGLGPEPDMRDPVRWRRWQFRRLWRIHFTGMKRSAAATRISIALHSYADARPNETPDPNSRDGIVAALLDARVPTSPRTIQEDLAGD